MNHQKLGIIYPNIPFLWHYNDFANLYPSIEQKQLSCDEFKLLNDKYNLNLLDKYINTEYYLHKQYLGNEYFYNNKNNEFYISFHTWLLKQLEGDIYQIGSNDIYYKFNFKCYLIPIYGTINTHFNFPEKIINKKDKIIKIINGINITNNHNIHNNKLFKRTAIVHKHNGFTRFSPYQMCNFIIPKNNNHKIIAFVSVITDIIAFKLLDKYNNDNDINDNDNNDNNIEYGCIPININKSCITIHIIRNEFNSDNIDDIKQFSL
jgi:hypothetical protein